MFKARTGTKGPRKAKPPARGRPRKHARGSLSALLIRVPKELHAQLRHVAIDEGRSLNDILTEVISAWYERRSPRRSRRG
jgi:predicted GNAT superfamily acetyltransferase